MTGSGWSGTTLRRRTGGVLGLAVMIAGSVTLLAPATATALQQDGSGPGVAPDPEPTSSSRALAVLERAATADQTTRYSGTQFVSAWSATGTSSTLVDVANEPGHGTAYRVRGSDGAASGAFSQTSVEPGLQLDGGPVALVAEHFTVETAGRDEVSGRTTRVLEMTGAGGVTAARLWVDAKSGVLLRREVYDADGRTVRASAYVQVQISRKAGSGHLPPALPVAAAAELTDDDVDELRAAGCTCPDLLAGRLSLYRVREVATDGATVLQLSYSDGLSTISLFEQPGAVDPDAMSGYTEVRGDDGRRWTSGDLPVRVVWSADETVFTVLADAPGSLVDEVVADLPAGTAPHDGVADRIGRGLVRVGSWVNPFG